MPGPVLVSPITSGGVQGLAINVVVCVEGKSRFSVGDMSTFCISIALIKIYIIYYLEWLFVDVSHYNIGVKCKLALLLNFNRRKH